MGKKVADACQEQCSGASGRERAAATGDIQNVIELVRNRCRQLEEGIRWLESFQRHGVVQSLEVELEQVKQSAKRSVHRSVSHREGDWESEGRTEGRQEPSWGDNR